MMNILKMSCIYDWSVLLIGRHGALPLTHLCRAMDGREQSHDATLAEYSASLQSAVVRAPCILQFVDRLVLSSSVVVEIFSTPRTGAEATFTVVNFTMNVGLLTLPCLFARHGWSTGNRDTIKGDNYTSVDPKQFTVNKFRLKPVILISECFCSRCGHTNQHPPPTWRETTGDNGRQRETTGDKTTSEPKKPTTPTNTKAARSKVALRTPTVNCLGKKGWITLSQT